MSNEAVVQAEYVDLRFIKTRKTAQVVLEIPIEQADAFITAFGSPRPDVSVPVVIARMDASKVEKPKGGKLAQRAGILCNEGAFHRFLSERHQMCWSADGAAHIVRRICGVNTRSNLDHEDEPARKFKELEAEYKAWLTVAA